MIPRPSAVLFDLFHTLVVLRPGGRRGKRVHDALGLSREAWSSVFFADEANRLRGAISDRYEAMRVVAHAADPSIPEERIRRAADERAIRLEDALTNPEPFVTDGLERLRDAGLPLALVSNAAHEEIEAWPRSPLAAFFEPTVFSCHVWHVKPEPAIYDAALEHLALEPRDCLFVGDGGSDEMRGAKDVGLRTALVTGFAEDLFPARVEKARAHADHEVTDVSVLADRILAG